MVFKWVGLNSEVVVRRVSAVVVIHIIPGNDPSMDLSMCCESECRDTGCWSARLLANQPSA